jgi:hypothetical protein
LGRRYSICRRSSEDWYCKQAGADDPSSEEREGEFSPRSVAGLLPLSGSIDLRHAVRVQRSGVTMMKKAIKFETNWPIHVSMEMCVK